MDITLVVMAAGMGSRFGGLKQAEPICEDGKGILDFSVYDAKKAGFTKAVFIIRENMKKDFLNLVGHRIEKTIPTEYVIQDTSILPEGRTKPFGTGHAILCCRGIVNEPFAIINADDYYGANAFYDIAEHLKTAKPGEYAMTAYELGKTLSPNGTVSRGVCEIENGYLKKVTETFNITSEGTYQNGDETVVLPPDTPVSMNLWGLTPDIFDRLADEFGTFLTTADLMKAEFYVPMVISSAVDRGLATVKVFRNADRWYGITYRADLSEIKAAVKGYVEHGMYPGI